jgi:two-component system, sensor histidine kinase and response regulator
MRSFRYRQLLLFLIPVLILVGSIFYALDQTRELKNALQWVNHTYQSIITLESLVLNISEAESLSLNYLLTGNESSLNNYSKTLTLVNEDLDYIRFMIQDIPSQHKNVNELILLTIGKIDLQNESINLSKEKKLPAGLLISKFNLGRLYLEKIKVIKGLIESDTQLLLNKRLKIVNDNLGKTLYAILFSFTAALIVGVFIFRFILKYIKAENKLKSELMDLNENKNKFFSIISHD